MEGSVKEPKGGASTIDPDHPFEMYKHFSEFRVNVHGTIKSKRDPKLVYRDIDKTLARIANSIKKGYTLPNQVRPCEAEYRPYPYFEITWSEINNDRNFEVVISRGVMSIMINQDNWSKFYIWATKWNIRKPENLLECEDVMQFYMRWW
ncbi:hypothetical protein D5W64_12235 [Salmonella enterica subsp. enterica serovar Saintpaul]|nr:hypothetical protein [Salmonella enterica subsp. enterica serovar Saintpaul]